MIAVRLDPKRYRLIPFRKPPPRPARPVPILYTCEVLANRGHPQSPAPLADAVQQIGLKLEARKAPLDVLVIDEALKTPTAN